MKKRVLLMALIINSIIGFSQPIIEFEKNYGGSSNDFAELIQQTSDGGYIVVGTTESNDGDVTENQGGKDFWALKLSTTGVIEWQKTLGGSGRDQATSAQQTSDDGYIIAGLSGSNDGDVTGNQGGVYDVWVVKLTNSGDLEWQQTYGGSSEDFATSIQQTLDGGYIFSGGTSSIDGDVGSTNGGADYWVVKINSIGAIEWQKTYGGSSLDVANSIQQTNDGGYIVSGRSSSNNGDITNNHGLNDYWIVKITSFGEIEWQNSLGGSGLDGSRSIQQTSDNGYVVVGSSESNDGDVTENLGGYDYWIVKLTSTGNIEWQKSYGGSGDDVGWFIQQTESNGFIIVGLSDSINGDVTGNHGDFDYWMVKLSSNGTLNWQKSLGGTNDDRAYSINQTLDGGYIVAGSSTSNDGDVTFNFGSRDYWLVKLSPYLGIDDNEFKNIISLYPNPTNDIVTIKAEDLKEITIYNILGKKVYFKELSGESTANIDVSHLAKGVYTVVVSTSNQQEVKKLLIN